MTFFAELRLKSRYAFSLSCVDTLREFDTLFYWDLKGFIFFYLRSETLSVHVWQQILVIQNGL